MRRVVRPGGTVATYIWDLPQGFPYYTAFAILRDLGVLPDRVAADESTALPQLQALWQRAGLQNVAYRTKKELKNAVSLMLQGFKRGQNL